MSLFNVELQPNQVLEKLRTEHPGFPLYLKKFNSPYFVYSNNIDFQGQKYTIYARRNQAFTSIEFYKCQLPSVELKEIAVSDVGISKAVPTFTF